MFQKIFLLFLLITTHSLHAGNTPIRATQERDLDEELRQASREGDVDKIRTLIDRGANVNARAAYGYLCDLIYYLEKTFLYDYPFQPDGWAPLHYACVRGHVEAVKTLIELGADTNLLTWTSRSPLSIAVPTSNAELVKLVISDQTINVRDLDGRTPLYIALSLSSHSYNENVVLTLIKGGAADIIKNSIDIWRVLNFCSPNVIDCIFKEAGSNFDQYLSYEKSYDRTLLMQALKWYQFYHGKQKIWAVINGVGDRFDTDQTDCNGMTTLAYALETGDEDVIQAIQTHINKKRLLLATHNLWILTAVDAFCPLPRDVLHFIIILAAHASLT